MAFLEEHHKNNVLTYLKHGNYYNKTKAIGLSCPPWQGSHSSA